MWIGIPYTMMTFSGVLMNIPAELYESAEMDGAGPVRRFISITLPYMFFVTAPATITTFVTNFNNFNVIYLLTAGGPFSLDYYQAGKTDLLVTWLYKLTVNRNDYSLASTIGIFIFMLVGSCSLLVYNRTRREEGGSVSMKNMRRRKIVSSVALNVVIAVLAMLWLVPVFWLVVSSFRAEQGAYTSYLWPKSFTFGNYVRLFTDRKLFDFPRWFGNTMLVAGCSCAITTILVLMVAYVYSRLRFPSRKFLMNASLVLGMFPGFMSIIAIYHFMKAVSLDQTLLALILVYSGGAALNYYIAKGYFDTIPRSLDEAAILDGATNSTIFWKIILPNAKPVIATTAINAFINPIVDYIFVSVIMKDNYNNFTVAKGLYTMVDKTNIYEYYTVFCAGAVIVAIPVVLLFIRMQKYYVAGVVGGSVKG